MLPERLRKQEFLILLHSSNDKDKLASVGWENGVWRAPDILILVAFHSFANASSEVKSTIP